MRVLHLNATPSGGGVAELLSSLIPLLRECGLDAVWKVLPKDVEFFKITKSIHNALQGADYSFTDMDVERYMEHDRLAADSEYGAYDVVVVHDPQPLAFRHFAGHRDARWIWRCHIDTSTPNDRVWKVLKPFIEEYDAAVFTSEKFVPPDLDMGTGTTHLIAPAIDPLATKNRELPDDLVRDIIAEFGVDLDRPLITQVSRFDPWKDPGGVVRLYREARKTHPDLQLAMLAFMATDDPEAWDIYELITRETEEEPDVHILSNLNGVGRLEVNAFQRASDVVLQKSIREGFGLVVSEAMWKQTPVVAAAAGGIPLQMSNGVGGYLAEGEDDYLHHILTLLADPAHAHDVATRGQQHVREHFLVTRLLLDNLKLYRDVTSDGERTRPETREIAGVR